MHKTHSKKIAYFHLINPTKLTCISQQSSRSNGYFPKAFLIRTGLGLKLLHNECFLSTERAKTDPEILLNMNADVYEALCVVIFTGDCELCTDDV